MRSQVPTSLRVNHCSREWAGIDGHIQVAWLTQTSGCTAVSQRLDNKCNNRVNIVHITYFMLLNYTYRRLATLAFVTTEKKANLQSAICAAVVSLQNKIKGKNIL